MDNIFAEERKKSRINKNGLIDSSVQYCSIDWNEKAAKMNEENKNGRTDQKGQSLLNDFAKKHKNG